MIVQIYGAGFDNRGAQLMLLATVQRLRELAPDTVCAVDLGRSTVEDRGSHGLRTLVPPVGERSPRKTRLVGAYSLMSHGLSRAYNEQLGLVRRCDVDALLDISGYAYGDKWPAPIMAAAAARVSDYRRRGKPVVLLPQMFGPFEDPAKRAAFEPIFRGANLLYAREEESLRALRSLGQPNDADRIRLSPDITIWVDPLPPPVRPEAPYACLVPNAQMTRHASQTWGDTYLEAMVRAAGRLQRHGIEPWVVVHDNGPADLAMGEQIAQAAGLPAERVLVEKDPQRIKGFLRDATMVIGSRFHALVSSLSSGTPVIALGWAHKYETLTQDFGVAEFCCQHNEGADCTIPHIDRLTDETQRREVEQTILNKKAEARESNEKMWREVAQTIGLN
ncbi:polysaccharide pyruvyl transferase family protein [Botrimarina sp.]|uniref:polysaccharide pyruvyl transferase family protein n=1 Tax=Botrimarina sp. TaxID=2795802 RepID=UPI0032F0277D